MLCYLCCLIFNLNINVFKFSSFSSVVVRLYLVLISCLEGLSPPQDDISILDFSIMYFLSLPLCVCVLLGFELGFAHARQVFYQLLCITSSHLSFKQSIFI